MGVMHYTYVLLCVMLLYYKGQCLYCVHFDVQSISLLVNKSTRYVFDEGSLKSDVCYTV